MFHVEQNSYNIENEIILILLNNNAHVRSLAKLLDNNHMTISRTLNKLRERNIVDYMLEGRNKSYFLKKNSTEACSSVFSSEHYKLIRTLAKYPRLRIVISAIQKNRNIKLALLFGSYAKGTAKNESDIDIYIETNNNGIKKDIEKLDSKVDIKIGRYDSKNLVIKEVKKNHVIIKGVERYYEKESFFEET